MHLRLVVKKPYLKVAEELFANTDIRITTEGRPYLGVAIGTKSYVDQHVTLKVDELAQCICNLSEIAISQPHAAYSALTHGLQSKWTYLSHVKPNISGLLRPLDMVLQVYLIPALTTL